MSEAMWRCVYLALTSALLLVTAGTTAEGCSCERLHPQQHFCAAAYVIGGRILKREYVLINTKTQTGGVDPDPLPEVQPHPGGLHPLPDEAFPEHISPDGLVPLPHPEGLQPLPHPEGLHPLPMPEGLQPVPPSEEVDPLPLPDGHEPLPHPDGVKLFPMPGELEPVSQPEGLGPLAHPDGLQSIPQPDDLQPEGLKPPPNPEGFQPEGLKPLPRPEGLQPMAQPEGLEPLPHPEGLQPSPEELQPHPELPPLPLPEDLEHHDTNTERVETPPITSSSLEASLMATTGAIPTLSITEVPSNETVNTPPSSKDDKVTSPEDKPHPLINPESMEAWNYKIIYTVRLKQIYKTGELSEDWKVGDEVHLETPASAGHCGMTTLKNDKNYIISGRLPGRLNLCDWTHEHHRLTSRQKQGLKSMYGKYCDSCQILACPSRHCKKPKENKHKTCLYDASLVRIGAAYNPYDCLASHSRCALRGGHKCKWQKNSDYHACEKRLP